MKGGSKTFNFIINADVMDGLKTLPSNSIHCCVTSPPYYHMRDYGVQCQIGLEPSPSEYVTRLVEVFHEVHRVLRDDGTLWLNLGDSYCGGGRACDTPKQQTNRGTNNMPKSIIPNGMKVKDLIGIPWTVAFALREDGWYLRQDIIWSKPNPMPESVKDRCTKSHEYIFLLSKSSRYYFDAEAISEPIAESTKKRLSQDIEHQKGSDRVPGKINGTMKAVAPRYSGNKYTATPEIFNRTKSGNAYHYSPMRNKRDVWSISTKPFKEAHFATFPLDLVEPCILAGSPENGIVLDPFMGSGTVAVSCIENHRQYVGCELNPAYVAIAENRISTVIPKVMQLNKKIPLWLDDILPPIGGSVI